MLFLPFSSRTDGRGIFLANCRGFYQVGPVRVSFGPNIGPVRSFGPSRSILATLVLNLKKETKILLIKSSTSTFSIFIFFV
uniref:Uncharacterized protein n=1 Tax=Meloidogyne enterolobii TaxID=390850 RepID=A0A6V7V597_MELEN|nr:unnamed protein product [Meloidogyne enterolobii]